MSSSIDDMFIMPVEEPNSNIIDDAPPAPATEAAVEPELPKLKPKIATASATPKAETKAETQPEDELRILNAKIRDIENTMKLLQLGRDNVKLRAAAIERQPIDWTKVSEKDIFELDMPVELIDHTMPDYMNVEAKDSSMALRWVHKMPRRLGPVKAMGFQFAHKEDIEGELNVAIEENADGRLQSDDVILMIIPKRIYFGMLRKNHEKALSMVDSSKKHKIEKDRVMNDIRNVNPGDFDRYASRKQLEVFIPGEI